MPARGNDSASKPLKGCYNCMKRRIVCDRIEPECGKCLKKGLICPGLGIRYRFNDGIAARGKLRGQKYQFSDSIPESPGHKPLLKSITWIQDSAPNESRSGKINETVATTSTEIATASRTEDGGEELLVISSSTNSKASDVGSFSVPAPMCGLDFFNAKTRSLFSHFSLFVSPVMILIDGQSNGYRHHILPLAYTDPLIQRAVCVASAFHLSVRNPDMRGAAEAGRAAIIQELRIASSSRQVLNLSTWSTIVLLFIGGLIDGSSDILILYRMLMSFVSAKKGDVEDSGLGVFLDQQTQLIEFFTRPTLSEDEGIATISKSSQPMLQDLELPPLGPSLTRLTILLYSEAYCQASAIYLLRANSSHINIDGPLAIRLVAQLKDLLAGLDPSSAGAHTLVWPYFVAAAESVLEEHRTFFYQRLEFIWDTTGYRNVYIAMQALSRIWERRPEQRWTAMLPDIAMVIM